MKCLYELDEGEATGKVMHYCSEVCRRNNILRAGYTINEDGYNYPSHALGDDDEYIPGTVCTECGVELDINYSSEGLHGAGS